MKLLEKAESMWTQFRAGWSRPHKGKYISYKEMGAYSVGGMGVQFIMVIVGYIGLSAGSTLIGSTFGLRPIDLQIMNTVSAFFQGFVVTPIRGMILDNTRSKQGKFRPYIFTMGIPTVALALLLVYLPIDNMTYVQIAVSVFVIYNLIQIFWNFYFGSYGNLAQVMSPNTEERATTLSISSVIYSMAPTLTGLLIPIISDKTGGLYNIKTYRIIFPIFSILGLIIGYLAYFGTKERIVVAKKYVPKVGFMEGLEKMAKNKYFWIINASGWIGFLKGATGVIFPWLFIYGTQNMVLYGIFTTVMGTASLFPMLFAPIFIKWLGKKKLVLASNFLNAIAAALLIPVLFIPGTMGSILTFLLLYVIGFSGAFLIITGPAMWAETRDYQQYRTGDRLEGFEGTLGGIVGTVITAATGYALPAMYEYFGLLDNYDILFNTEVRQNIFLWSAVFAIIGSILTALPYFIWDLSEKRHYNIIKILKVRALFEDYANGDLTDGQLVDTIEAIEEAYALSNAEKRVVDKKAAMSKAKSLPHTNKEEKLLKAKAIREAQKQLNADRAYNDSIDASIMVISELHKFETEEMKAKLDEALRIIEEGPIGLGYVDAKLVDLANAKKMPVTTKKEFKERAVAIKKAKKAVKRAKLINKMYPDHSIAEPDYSAAQTAFEMPENTKEERRARIKAIKIAEKSIMKFKKVARPFIEAQKLIAQKEHYDAFAELKEMYPEAKERYLEQERIDDENRKRLEQERREEIERIKEERFNKLSPEKQAKIMKKREEKARKKAEKASGNANGEDKDSENTDDLKF